MSFVYSDVKKRHQRAFTTTEVCKMIGRTKVTVENVLLRGEIEKPQNTYGIDENRNFFQYMWREEDIMALHEYLTTVHYGRPRKDGLVTPLKLPTARELRAMIRQDVILYVKNKNGEFVPTWEAEQF